jgi:large subunit ribosomal protein L21
MYAVVKLAGKQWKLQEQERILVDKLAVEKDEKFLIEQVLLLKKKDATFVGAPFVEKALVQTKVLDQVRDKKIIVFKKKRRKGYKKKQGHRQYKTLLLIEKILFDGKSIGRAERAVSSKKVSDKKVSTSKTSIKAVSTGKTSAKAVSESKTNAKISDSKKAVKKTSVSKEKKT